MSKPAVPRVACVIAVFALAAFIVSLALSWRQNKRAQMRAAVLPVTIKQAQPIIRAIKRYSKERRALPQSLFVLMPKYIGQIPDAGPAAKNGWHYQVNTGVESGGWALSIKVRDEYSPNIVGFGDTFVFHPSGRYPDWAYGGGLIPFDKWGYYVE